MQRLDNKQVAVLSLQADGWHEMFLELSLVRLWKGRIGTGWSMHALRVMRMANDAEARCIVHYVECNGTTTVSHSIS
jgi:hypothetical protein